MCSVAHRVALADAPSRKYLDNGQVPGLALSPGPWQVPVHRNKNARNTDTAFEKRELGFTHVDLLEIGNILSIFIRYMRHKPGEVDTVWHGSCPSIKLTPWQ